jgi:hypothetical protein
MWLSNISLFCKLTIEIPWLPCLFDVANAVSSTVVLVNSATCDSVNSFHSAMCAFTSRCLPMGLLPCTDGWWRTSQTTQMMPGLLVSSIQQCKSKRYTGACLESLHAMRLFEPIFIEANEALNLICKVRSFKLRIINHSFLEPIITSTHKVLIDWESDTVVEIFKLSNYSWKTVKSYISVG